MVLNIDTVKADIEAWMINFLEVPHPALGSWSPCPYARSARLKKSYQVFLGADPYYDLAVDIARRLSDEGFSVISGGGPGIMEAANKGAYEGSSPSIGLNIELPHEQSSNTWQNISLSFRHFFARKVAFVKYADAYIVLPGGFGTIDELSEVLVLIQTGKTQRIPVVLVGTKFWEGLLKWFKDTLLANGMVESQDLELVQVIDDPKEIVEAIFHFYESRDIVPSETEHPHQSFL